METQAGWVVHESFILMDNLSCGRYVRLAYKAAYTLPQGRSNATMWHYVTSATLWRARAWWKSHIAVYVLRCAVGRKATLF